MDPTLFSMAVEPAPPIDTISSRLGLPGCDAATDMYSNVDIVATITTETYGEQTIFLNDSTITRDDSFGGIVMYFVSDCSLVTCSAPLEAVLLDVYFDSAITSPGVIGISGGLAFDNGDLPFQLALGPSATVSSVPIPAAVWLFGSALGGLGWMRRRKTV